MQEIVTRAASISSLVDTIQKQNYRILERIRPLTLHQIGLIDAIGDLVNSGARPIAMSPATLIFLRSACS